MSADPPNDTGDRTRWVCPGCEPDVDPLAEVISVRYCVMHEPSRVGSADAEAPFTECGPPSGTQESGGETNAQWCALIHRAGFTAPDAEYTPRKRRKARR